MAKREPIVIELGGLPYTIQPTTLGQLCKIAEAMEAKDRSLIEQARDVVRAALERDNSGAAEKLAELPATLGDLTEAMRAILVFTGWIVDSAPKPAEASAA